MSAYEDFNNAHIAHLEMIQGVIARLAREAALVKGWALTVSAAFFGFAATGLDWRLALVGMLPVAAFWGLNAYYLRAERMYRSLFDRVRRTHDFKTFEMNARNEAADSWLKTALSPTIAPFYGAISAVGVALIVAGALNN